MNGQPTPSLGRVLDILRGLGFVTEPARPGVVLYTHAGSGAEFLFRDRDTGTPARETELTNLRVQLTARGLLTDKELDALLNASPIATS